MHHHYIDRFAYQDSPIHRLDPRAKVLSVLAFTVALISQPRYAIPSPWFLVFPAVLLMVGRVPLRFVVKHTLLVSPFIVFAAGLSPVFDRAPMAIGSVTVRAGWIAALVLVLRFVLGMAALIALASTTRFPELLKGMEQMGVPRLLTTQLRFLYRYLFVLIDQAMHMRQARQVRDAGRGPLSARWRASGGQIGVLFLRTLESAERIHLAMVARGFEGEVRLLTPLRWRQADTLFLLAMAAYLMVVLMLQS